MVKLNQQIKKVLLGNGSGWTYADAAVRFPFLQILKKYLIDKTTCVKLFSVLKVTKSKQQAIKLQMIV